MMQRVEYSQVVPRSALLLLAGTAFACAAHAAPPDLAAVRAGYRSSESVLLDRHGEPLRECAPTRRGGGSSGWRSSEVSPALVAAVIAAEDRRFREHGGVDWAAFRALPGQPRRRPAPRREHAHDAARRDARREPARWHRRPRELRAEVAPGARRARARTRWTQGRDPRGLSQPGALPRRDRRASTPLRADSVRQAPGRAGSRRGRARSPRCVRAPNAAPSAVARRACAHRATPQGEPRGLRSPRAPRGPARRRDGHGSARASTPRRTSRARCSVAAGRSGPHARSTPALQRFARDALRRQLRELAGRNVEDGAVIVLDNATGEVLAWVGSSGELSGAARGRRRHARGARRARR